MTREPRYRPDSFGLDPKRWPVTGPAFVARWLSGLQANGEPAVDDADATALVMFDALTTYWRQRQTHGDAPYGIEPDRFVDAWASLVLRPRPR